MPIAITLSTWLINKFDELNKMYVDLKLYSSSQFKNIICTTKKNNNLFKLFIADKKKHDNPVYLEIQNVGNTLISSVEIIVNRKEAKTDNYYFIQSPIQSGNKLYIKIDYDIESITDILLISYLGITDKLHYFSSIKTNKQFSFFQNHKNNKQKYSHSKLSSKNKITMKENYI